eukprot:RCo021791
MAQPGSPAGPPASAGAGSIDPAYIVNGIWLGSFEATRPETLRSLGITSVLCCALELSYQERSRWEQLQRANISVKHLTWNDSLLQKIWPTPELDEALAWVDQVLASGQQLLINCRMGVSRSCSMVIAYLIHRLGHTYDSALALIRQKRPFVSPNIGFAHQLRQSEAGFRATTSSPERTPSPVQPDTVKADAAESRSTTQSPCPAPDEVSALSGSNTSWFQDYATPTTTAANLSTVTQAASDAGTSRCVLSRSPVPHSGPGTAAACRAGGGMVSPNAVGQYCSTHPHAGATDPTEAVVYVYTSCGTTGHWGGWEHSSTQASPSSGKWRGVEAGGQGYAPLTEGFPQGAMSAMNLSGVSEVSPGKPQSTQVWVTAQAHGNWEVGSHAQAPEGNGNGYVVPSNKGIPENVDEDMVNTTTEYSFKGKGSSPGRAAEHSRSPHQTGPAEVGADGSAYVQDGGKGPLGSPSGTGKTAHSSGMVARHLWGHNVPQPAPYYHHHHQMPYHHHHHHNHNHHNDGRCYSNGQQPQLQPQLVPTVVMQLVPQVQVVPQLLPVFYHGKGRRGRMLGM